MNNRINKRAFTLIEMLVAVAIVAAIVSMVYGSYLATSKSAQAYQAKMVCSRQVRQALRHISQEIRCAYAPVTADGDNSDSNTTDADAILLGQENGIGPQEDDTAVNALRLFEGDSGALSAEILRFVTAKTGHEKAERKGGLSEVAYRFDKDSATVLVSRQRFVGTVNDRVSTGDWRLLVGNVCGIELRYYDGLQWLEEWHFNTRRRLPGAVRIDITVQDENHRPCRYGTIAHVCCGANTTAGDTHAELGSAQTP